MFNIDQTVTFKKSKYIIVDKWKDGTGYRYEIKKAHKDKAVNTNLSWSVSEAVLTEEN